MSTNIDSQSHREAISNVLKEVKETLEKIATIGKDSLEDSFVNDALSIVQLSVDKDLNPSLKIVDDLKSTLTKLEGFSEIIYKTFSDKMAKRILERNATTCSLIAVLAQSDSIIEKNHFNFVLIASGYVNLHHRMRSIYMTEATRCLYETQKAEVRHVCTVKRIKLHDDYKKNMLPINGEFDVIKKEIVSQLVKDEKNAVEPRELTFVEDRIVLAEDSIVIENKHWEELIRYVIVGVILVETTLLTNRYKLFLNSEELFIELTIPSAVAQDRYFELTLAIVDSHRQRTILTMSGEIFSGETADDMAHNMISENHPFENPSDIDNLPF